MVTRIALKRRKALSTGTIYLSLGALLIGTAACGGSSAEAGGSASKTLTIGISTPETGPGVAYRGISDGTMAYLKWMNAKGGVGGYTFAFDEVDNQSTVAGGATAAQRLLAKKPFLLDVITTPPFSGAAGGIRSSGNTTTTLAQASGDAIKKANLPHVFGMYTDYTQESFYLLDYTVKTLSLKKVALLHDTLGDEAARQDGDYVKKLGGSLPLSISIPADATNMTSYVQKTADSGVEAVVLMTNVTVAGNFVKSARTQGLDIPILAFSPALDQSFVEIAGSSATTNFYVCSALPPLTSDSPEMKEFKEMAPKYAKDVLRLPGVVGWNAGAVIAEAIRDMAKSATAMTNANFEKALFGLTGKKVGFTTITIEPDYHNALVGRDGFKMYVVKGGEFVPTP